MVKKLGEMKARLVLLNKELKKNPVTMVFKEFSDEYKDKNKKGEDFAEALQVFEACKMYVKSSQFRELSSLHRKLLVKIFLAKEKLDIELPSAINSLSEEFEVCSKVYREKVLSSAVAKAEKHANKALARAESVKQGKRPRKN